jgi:hypothetical protein
LRLRLYGCNSGFGRVGEGSVFQVSTAFPFYCLT